MLDSPYQLVRRVSSINNLVSDLRLHLIPNLFAGWPQAPGEYRQAAHFEGDEMETFRCICTCFGWTCFFVCIHRRHHSFHHLCDGVNVWDAQIIFFSCLEHVHLDQELQKMLMKPRGAEVVQIVSTTRNSLVSKAKTSSHGMNFCWFRMPEKALNHQPKKNTHHLTSHWRLSNWWPRTEGELISMKYA